MKPNDLIRLGVPESLRSNDETRMRNDECLTGGRPFFELRHLVFIRHSPF